MNADVISFSERLPAAVNADKAQMVAAIQSFCMTRNFEDALSREEIGRLDKFDRVDAQRKSLLINTARYYRDNPKADVAVGVLTIITLLSDNDKGACTMSQTHIGLILSRTRTTISEAVTRLKLSGLVQSENGKSLAYPTIPRVVTQHYNHVVWVAEALKAIKTCPVEQTGQNLSRGPDTCNTPVPQKRQVNSSTCPVVASEPVCSTGHKFTKENSVMLKRVREVEDHPPASVKIAASIAFGVLAATSPLPAAAAPEPAPITQSAKLSLDQMIDRMADTAGPAIGRGANLLMWSDLQQWLRADCDFETDILQTIKAVSARHLEQGRAPIGSWSYFTKAIANAKATRLKPMEEGQAQPKFQHRSRPKTVDEMSAEEYRVHLEKGFC